MSRGADTATRIPEARLIELRRDGKSRDHGFVDPHVLRRCTDALDRRGEPWAAAVLGRDISRRSLGVPHRPYLYASMPVSRTRLLLPTPRRICSPLRTSTRTAPGGW